MKKKANKYEMKHKIEYRPITYCFYINNFVYLIKFLSQYDKDNLEFYNEFID